MGLIAPQSLEFLYHATQKKLRWNWGGGRPFQLMDIRKHKHKTHKSLHNQQSPIFFCNTKYIILFLTF